jgi:flagellar biosynthetic protein FlhB
MADTEEDKTESPTARTLEQAAEQGDLPLVSDLGATAAVLAMLATLVTLGPMVLTTLVHLVRDALNGMAHPTLVGAIPKQSGSMAAWLLALVTPAAAAAAVAFLAQTQGRVWVERAIPDFTRVFSLQRLTHTFSAEGLSMLAFKSARLGIILGAVWWTMRDQLANLQHLLVMEPGSGVGAALSLLGRGLWAALGAVAFTAAGEAGLVWYQFHKRHRMTREEVKRQHKEDDGDPAIKGRRRAQMRELVKNRVRTAVPTATVVLVNPTHVAVALRYSRGKEPAPRVVAKGKGQRAQAIRDLAHQHGVPVMQDIPLARLLYQRVKVGREIPAETFKAVAAVLAVVMKNKR